MTISKPLPPSVAPNTATLAQDSATVITITGSGFDAVNPSFNSVSFNLGAVGTVTAATATSLTVALSTPHNGPGILTAVVTSPGGTSGAPVQVATATVRHAYVTSDGPSYGVTACTLTLAGAFSSCSAPVPLPPRTTPFSPGLAIAFNQAYVISGEPSQISLCPLDPVTGEFVGTCSAATVPGATQGTP